MQKQNKKKKTNKNHNNNSITIDVTKNDLFTPLIFTVSKLTIINE